MNQNSVVVMQNVVEDIRRGIEEIRDMLGPMSLKLQNLDQKVTESRISAELRTSEFDARIEANSLKISEQTVTSREHSLQIANLFERVQWLEACLNVPKRSEKEPGKSDQGQEGLHP